MRYMLFPKKRKIVGIMHVCQKVLKNITSGYGNHKTNTISALLETADSIIFIFWRMQIKLKGGI